jgi:hypothetical protein
METLSDDEIIMLVTMLKYPSIYKDEIPAMIRKLKSILAERTGLPINIF